MISATKSSEQADRPRTIRPKLSHSHTVDVVMLPPLLRALQHVVGSIADGDGFSISRRVFQRTDPGKRLMDR